MLWRSRQHRAIQRDRRRWRWTIRRIEVLCQLGVHVGIAKGIVPIVVQVAVKRRLKTIALCFAAILYREETPIG